MGEISSNKVKGEDLIEPGLSSNFQTCPVVCMCSANQGHIHTNTHTHREGGLMIEKVPIRIYVNRTKEFTLSNKSFSIKNLSSHPWKRVVI